MNNIPRVRFAHLPTPVEMMPRLSVALGGIRLMVKRDDQTGLGLGGNKTRKLEFLIAEAQANGAKKLISAGAVQSNHCRQVAAAAAKFGFACTLVLSGHPVKISSGNLFLDNLFNAQIIWTEGVGRDQVLQETFQASWERGERPYLIPYGGSSAVGAAAYAFALKELLEQGINPDWIVFASSSGGTQAGLVVGARSLGFKGKILGISVDQPAIELQGRVAALANLTADLLGERTTFVSEDILVSDAYLGNGYAVMGNAEQEAIELFARQEGLLLDPVYTGRAAAGLIDLARKGFFAAGESILLWHTGGTPALFAQPYVELLAF
jgi:D-cysteine desulfhydrase family pyridoxal phosphate-dependent enzyme